MPKMLKEPSILREQLQKQIHWQWKTFSTITTTTTQRSSHVAERWRGFFSCPVTSWIHVWFFCRMPGGSLKDLETWEVVSGVGGLNEPDVWKEPRYSNGIWRSRSLSSASLRKLCLRVKSCWFSIPNGALMFHLVLWDQSWLQCYWKDPSAKFACEFDKEGLEEGNESCWNKSCHLKTNFKVRRCYQSFFSNLYWD